jgi:dUTP pyrophosphatase
MAFEVVDQKFRKHEGEVILPQRQTAGSAGYDFHSMEDKTLYQGAKHIFWTDVKVVMPLGLHLEIVPRSSMGIKKDIKLANTEGKIDPDYSDETNQKTGGNIAICLKNTGHKKVSIKRGDRIAQGFIIPYYTFDDKPTTVRKGGIGSTGE